MLLEKLRQKNLIHPPVWLIDNTQYLTIMGSIAYGVSDKSSDIDIYGCCIPPKFTIFPHLAGEIHLFSKPKHNFEQWQQHHIIDKEERKEYDLQVFNIVKYFRLLLDNNPNCLDSIFTNSKYVLHCTEIGNMIRDNRKLFIHKGLYHRFCGYSKSQQHKMRSKNPIGKRKEVRDKYGFDVKFGMHIIRLLSQCEQLLIEHDLNLEEKSRREHMKAIRRGEVKEKDIYSWASSKEEVLGKLYIESSLPYKPNEEKIKQLLLQCLEHHYGNLDNCIQQNKINGNALGNDIKKVLQNYGII